MWSERLFEDRLAVFDHRRAGIGVDQDQPVGTAARIRRVISIMLLMPFPQLAPTMSAPAAAAAFAARSGFTPIMVRNPLIPASKLKVQITGRSVFSFTALIACSASTTDDAGLDANGVCAAFGQGNHLLLEGLIELFGGDISAFFQDDMAGRANRGGHVALVDDGFFRQLGGGEVDVVHLVGKGRSSST